MSWANIKNYVVTEGMTMDQAPSFKFSFGRIKESERDLNLQISALEKFLDNVVQGLEIHGHPVVSYILQLTHEEDDLVRLGKALTKIAPRVQQLDNLKKRKDLFDLAVKDPNWLVWAFGDFEEELEQLTPETFKED